MDVRNSWLVTLTEQQKRLQATSNNGEFLRQIRIRQRRRRAQSARLRLAASAAVLAWLLAGIQGVIKP